MEVIRENLKTKITTINILDNLCNSFEFYFIFIWLSLHSSLPYISVFLLHYLFTFALYVLFSYSVLPHTTHVEAILVVLPLFSRLWGFVWYVLFLTLMGLKNFNSITLKRVSCHFVRVFIFPDYT